MRVVQSAAASRRFEAAVEFILSFPKGTELLLLGATREAIDEIARGLTSWLGATFGLHRFTLTQLASRLAEPLLAAQGIAPCTSLASEALAARATHEVLGRGGIPYFKPVARLPGFPGALAASLAELRSAGIGADHLTTRLAPAPEIGVLLREYETRMREARLADRAALFESATSVLRAGRGGAWVGLPLLLLDVSIDSPVEEELVATIASLSSSVLATVPAGDDRTRSALVKLAAIDELAEARDIESSSLERLRRYLFSVEQPPRREEDGQVRFFSAPGEAREAVEVARAILAEARAGTRFDEMAVFLRIPEASSSLLQTAFRRAAIPAYFARGTKRPDPSGRAFLALLACVSDDLSARRFAEYLSFGQVPGDGDPRAAAESCSVWSPPRDDILGRAADGVASDVTDEEHAPSSDYADSPRAPWSWEKLLVGAAVIGGADRWERRLGGLENELRTRGAELASEDPESPRLAGLERQLAQLGHLKAFALPLIEDLAELRPSAVWGEWIDRLSLLAPRVLQRPERVLRLLQELQPMAAVGPVTITEVREVLALRLSFLEEDPPASRYGHVFVATPEMARGRTFKTVFVLGLAERIFPQRPREDPLLLDAVRKEIGGELVTQEDRGQRERLLLRLAVGAAAERIVLSYPRLDVVQARPRVTSFYGLDVVRAIRGTIPDFEQFERDAAALVNARLAWPAPPDPAQAIDSIEHDLSVLWGLLHPSDPSSSAGRARYLLELNAHLARSLRGRYARWEARSWSAADGLVRNTAAIEEALASSRLNRRPYSPSALEKFASCPYRFFLSSIHGLEPREDAAPLERIDPLARGNLIRRVQAETLRVFSRDGLLPLGKPDLARAEEMLQGILAATAASFEEEVAPAIPRVWHDEIAAIRTDLLSWLRRLVADGKLWCPHRFEFGFGLPGDRTRDPASVAAPVVLEGGAILRGAVDLVERSAAGDKLRVTDYKTGAARAAKGLVVGGGEILQPVLYGLAVEAALGLPVSEARLFYCTGRGGFTERVVSMDERARAAGHEVLAVIDRAIASGFLPPAPRQEACRFCEFRVVCGPWEEERARRKDARPLADLAELRRRP